MAEDNELERRAVEELLRETDRARVRAETMGPAGWLKCPLQGTNKRFLVNTLRSTDPPRRSDQPRDGQSTTRGRLSRASPDRSPRERSRTPVREHRGHGGHPEHRHRHRDSCSSKEKRDRDGEKSCKVKDNNRARRHRKDGQSRRDRHSLHE